VAEAQILSYAKRRGVYEALKDDEVIKLGCGRFIHRVQGFWNLINNTEDLYVRRFRSTRRVESV
jgi:hypothetical protein